MLYRLYEDHLFNIKKNSVLSIKFFVLSTLLYFSCDVSANKYLASVFSGHALRDYFGSNSQLLTKASDYWSPGALGAMAIAVVCIMYKQDTTYVVHAL